MFSSPSSGAAGVTSATSANSSVSSPVATLSYDCLELCGRTLEKFLHSDSQWPQLQDKLARGNMGKSVRESGDADLMKIHVEPFFTSSPFFSGTGGFVGSLRVRLSSVVLSSIVVVPSPSDGVDQARSPARRAGRAVWPHAVQLHHGVLPTSNNNHIVLIPNVCHR